MEGALAIILYDHPLEHTADYASQTCRYLRKHNLVIGLLLKDGRSLKEIIFSREPFWFIRKLGTNFYQVKPLYVVPFRRFQVISRINLILNALIVRLYVSILSAERRIKQKYLWVYNPEHYPVVRLFASSFFTVYDCVDYHGSHGYDSAEKTLLQRCTKVFVNSHVLYERHKNVRPDIALVPLGFDIHRFFRQINRSGKHLASGNPILGYIGGINSRLDFPLLLKLIKNNSRWKFVFVGPIQKHETDDSFYRTVKPQIDELLHLSNVQYIRHAQGGDVASFLSQCTICMIPYDVRLPFNKYCYPMKLFEYFYMGKPVIATPITELRRFPEFIRIGASAIEWEKHINALLLRSWPEKYKRAQRLRATQNSWDAKLDDECRIIQEYEKNETA